MSPHRVTTVVRRHVYVLKRSPHRFFDLTVWPLLDVLLFGSLGAYVAQQGGTRAGAPYLLAGILMFHVLYQIQIAICTAPNAITRTVDTHDLKMVPQAPLPRGRTHWIDVESPQATRPGRR